VTSTNDTRPEALRPRGAGRAPGHARAGGMRTSPAALAPGRRARPSARAGDDRSLPRRAAPPWRRSWRSPKQTAWWPPARWRWTIPRCWWPNSRGTRAYQELTAHPLSAVMTADDNSSGRAEAHSADAAALDPRRPSAGSRRTRPSWDASRAPSSPAPTPSSSSRWPYHDAAPLAGPVWLQRAGLPGEALFCARSWGSGCGRADTPHRRRPGRARLPLVFDFEGVPSSACR